ncbi:bile salt-activated lipase-like [Haliotis rubra]|uniref:bile salt-activated lipase-like n=1 Tax=Haliotis rubra TaxID=36100 RepID=UPI001EE5D029|nr:bile salt-activated lipase-like [Haliotis rubra]
MTAASDYGQLCNDSSFRLPAAVQRLHHEIIGSCATTATSDYRQLGHSCDHPILLGPLGFLSTEDDVSARNYGIWDQHLALQWIKKPIASFGGDIKSITLMGESAGPEDSHAERVCIVFMSIYRNSLKYARQLDHKVNFSSQGDSASMIACLRTVSAKKLTAASWPIGNEPVTALVEFFFVPTIDGVFVKDDPRTPKLT